MADQTNGRTDLKTAPVAAEDIGFRDQLAMMLRAFMASPLRNTILWMAAGALAVIVATSLGQIILNRWNRPFYDAIERRDIDAFVHQLMLFVAIAGGLLTLGVMQTWLNQMMKLKLREGLTRDLINEWMRPRRAFRLANAGAIGVNPDQRMQEDAGHLTDLTTGLTFGLVQSTILLISFVGVLWSLSSGFVFHVSGYSFAIPGYMVWAAIIYTGSASVLSWLVGRPLIALNSDRYSREADLRFSMMRVNEHVDAISLAGGEGDEKRRLETDLASVLGGRAAHLQRADTARMGDRRLWLGHGGGADPGCFARLFRGRHQLRRPDDGGRRVQPGAFVAALVHQQYRRHRRLARDLAARCRFPPGAGRGGCAP